MKNLNALFGKSKVIDTPPFDRAKVDTATRQYRKKMLKRGKHIFWEEARETTMAWFRSLRAGGCGV